jgi:hypothetical protein
LEPPCGRSSFRSPRCCGAAQQRRRTEHAGARCEAIAAASRVPRAMTVDVLSAAAARDVTCVLRPAAISSDGG